MLLRQIVTAQGVRGRGESVQVMVAGGPSRGEQYLVRFASAATKEAVWADKSPRIICCSI